MNKSLKLYFPIFVLPTLVAFSIGFVYPFFRGLYLSFCNFITTKNATFVGLENYKQALSDTSFLYSFGFTAVFSIASVLLINVLGFAIAYALTKKIRGANLYRTVFFMPNLIGGIVLGYIWQLIINGILRNFGTGLALDYRFGFLGLLVLMIWQQAGYMMIIYIAGLQAVPKSLYEASRIDGANARQTLFRITIPMVMPSITICTFLTLTNSFKLFDQNLALTGGAPGIVSEGGKTVYLTEMLALNIYNTFYRNANTRGVGQAKAVIFFLLVGVIALTQLIITRRKEVQQ